MKNKKNYIKMAENIHLKDDGRNNLQIQETQPHPENYFMFYGISN